MTNPTEQWVVSALRQATERMPLPPESRWIRERRSTPLVLMIAVVGATAIFIVAVGITIGALRVEPRAVPAAAPDAFAVAEDREWRITRFALPSELVVLRPAWVPSEYRGSAECPSPWALIGTDATPGRTSYSGYAVRYQGAVLPNGSCEWLVFYGHLEVEGATVQPGGLIETGTFSARGTTVHVRSSDARTNWDRLPLFPPPAQIQLWWNESGVHYQVTSSDLELVDLVRVIRSLEPVRRER